MSDYGEHGQGSGHVMAGAFFQLLKDFGSWADKNDGLRVALDNVVQTDDGVRFLYNAYGVHGMLAYDADVPYETKRTILLDVEWAVANWRHLDGKRRGDLALIWEGHHEALIRLDDAYREGRQDERVTLVDDARAFREAYEADEIQAAADYATDRGIKEFKENETLVKEIPNPTNDGSVNA